MLKTGEGSIHDVFGGKHLLGLLVGWMTFKLLYFKETEVLAGFLKTYRFISSLASFTLSDHDIDNLIAILGHASQICTTTSEDSVYELAQIISTLDVDTESSSYRLLRINELGCVSTTPGSSKQSRSIFSPHICAASLSLLPNPRRLPYFWHPSRLAEVISYLRSPSLLSQNYPFSHHFAAGRKESFAFYLKSKDILLRQYVDCCTGQLTNYNQHDNGTLLDASPQPVVDSLLSLFEDAERIAFRLTKFKYDDGELAWVRHRSDKLLLLSESLKGRCLYLLQNAFYAPLDAYTGPVFPIPLSQRRLDFLSRRASLRGLFVFSAWLEAVEMVKPGYSEGAWLAVPEKRRMRWAKEQEEYRNRVQSDSADPHYDERKHQRRRTSYDLIALQRTAVKDKDEDDEESECTADLRMLDAEDEVDMRRMVKENERDGVRING